MPRWAVSLWPPYPPRMNPFGIIFDMDGVIVDSNPAHKESLQQFVKSHGYTLDEQQLKEKIFGRNNREWIPMLFADRTLTPAEISRYADEKEQLFRDLYRDAVAPLPGLRDFLDQLQAATIPYAIATSAPRANVDFVLDHTGLTRYFTTILHEAHFERGKPHPEIYQRATAALRLEPTRCVVFEDSLSGITAARRAGCPVVGVTTTHAAGELAGTLFTVADFTHLQWESIAACL